MKTIYKYPLNLRVSAIDMPEGAEILDVQVQNLKPHIWALVDPSRPLEKRVFEIFGTGWDIEKPNAIYLATFQIQAEGLVWHAFEITC